MGSVTATEVLVQDRRHLLEEAARRYRQVQQLPMARRAPWRAGVGLILVRVGLRLAQVDPLRSAPSRLAQS